MSDRYVHTLVFTCPNCEAALACSFINDSRNPEDVDAKLFSLRCDICGLLTDMLGAEAMRNYTSEWTSDLA